MNRAKHVTFVALTLLLAVPILAAAPPPRTFGGGSFALELDGALVGNVTLVEGGNIFADVVKELPAVQFFVKKHLGSAASRDLVLEFAGGLDTAVANWIKGALERQYLPKDGAVVMFGIKGNVVSRLEFQDAQITQVTFPTLDGGSKELLRFSIRITPTSTTLNRKPDGTISSKQSTQKKALALAGNFRLAIDGLDMTSASHIDALTVNLPLVIDPSLVCHTCDPIPPTPVDFPNLLVAISAARADSVYEWLDEFVIQGENSDESEKSGALDYLTPTLQTALFQLSFKGLGVFEVTSVSSADTDAIARVAVSMYCERMEFNLF